MAETINQGNIEARMNEIGTYGQQFKNPLARDVFTHAIALARDGWTLEQNQQSSTSANPNREMR